MEGKIANKTYNKKFRKSREISFQYRIRIDEFSLINNKVSPQEVGVGPCDRKVHNMCQMKFLKYARF